MTAMSSSEQLAWMTAFAVAYAQVVNAYPAKDARRLAGLTASKALAAVRQLTQDEHVDPEVQQEALMAIGGPEERERDLIELLDRTHTEAAAWQEKYSAAASIIKTPTEVKDLALQKAVAAQVKAEKERDEALAIADTRNGHAIDNKERADKADWALFEERRWRAEVEAEAASWQKKYEELRQITDALSGHIAAT